MEEVVLKAKSRQVIGKQVKALRREGMLPAIIYGHVKSPLPIVLDFRETSRILPGITSSQLVAVELEGKRHVSLVRERQRHPVTGALLHIDFQEVSMTEKLRTMVIIELRGLSPAVKDYNGVLMTQQEEIEVECLPGELPERVVVDIAVLKEIGDTIYVRDLQLPPKVEVLTDPNDIVVVVTPPVAEPEAEVVEAAAPEPEVIERGKKEEEEF
jgi:large subunit ribosomal protein L25